WWIRYLEHAWLPRRWQQAFWSGGAACPTRRHRSLGGGKMNVPEVTPVDSSVSALEQARCIPPAKLRQEYLDLLELVGHGRFQLRILFCGHLSLVMVLFHDWSTHVLTQPVDHWCKPPALFAQLTSDQRLNVSVPVVEGSRGHHRHRPVRYIRPQHHRVQRIPPGSPLRQMGLQSATRHQHCRLQPTTPLRWDLMCDRAPYVPMTDVDDMLGGVLGAPLVGQLANRSGRRPAVFGALLLSMASVFTATAADSFPAFVVDHVLIALYTCTAYLKARS
ncbi:hypothetical protein MTO96_039529, partial [Rhipicephalus appendiculatus]